MALYHSELLPVDSAGQAIRPLDLVVIKEVPRHYWAEQGAEGLRSFSGCYGLVTYAGEGPVYEPYYLGDKRHPGWMAGDGSVVYVRSRRLEDDSVFSAEFWMPPGSLTRIQFNALIMNIFAEYPWEMLDEHGPGSHFFIRKGIPEYDYLERILSTPHEVLEEAHCEAMKVLSRAI